MQSKFKASKRDFVIAGLGAILGGGAMYFYDTYEINALNEEMDDMEDDRAYNTEIMADRLMGAQGGQSAAPSPSMADLEQGGRSS
ncbi:MAG: hypothetical protein WDW36_005855 [Sanguina aurantia]